MVNGLKYLSLLLIFFSLAVNAAADEAYCKKEWNKIVNSQVPFETALNKWLAKEDKCSGSGFYEKKLITLYIKLKKFKEARLIAKNAVKNKLPNKHDFQLKYFDTIFFEYVEKNETDTQKWKKLEKNYSNYFVLKKFIPYIRVSDININLGNYQKAKKVAEDGLKVSQEWGLHRNIMLANYNLKNYSEVPYNFKSALELYKPLISNKNLMIPLARSYIELKNWVYARNTLINLRKAVPEIEFDQDYIDAALLLKKRMEEAGVIKQ